MLAPAKIPDEFRRWNRRWHAPAGRGRALPGILKFTRLDLHYRGPFAWQENNTTRTFEYPWAFCQVARLGSNLSILELGGGLSGLQFVLAREGHRVTNLDPGLAAEGVGFELDAQTHERLCTVFRAPVRLVPEPIQRAGIPDHSIDAVLAVSAIEHFSACDLQALATHLPRVLRPGGACIFTIDLFLELVPFTRRPANRFGSNADVRALLEVAGLELEVGNAQELYGFPSFSSERVLENLSKYLIGSYPALVQCVVARVRQPDTQERK